MKVNGKLKFVITQLFCINQNESADRVSPDNKRTLKLCLKFVMETAAT